MVQNRVTEVTEVPYFVTMCHVHESLEKPSVSWMMSFSSIFFMEALGVYIVAMSS